MAGELFYSEIDSTVQAELQLRKTYSVTRSNDAIIWQTSRTSWGKLTLLNPDTNEIEDTIINPISDSFRPIGYLNTPSYRTPPVLQLMTVQFADTSGVVPGLINDASLQILIPDVNTFNTEFEPRWLRVGKKIQIEFGHSVGGSQANRGKFDGVIVNFKFTIQEDATVAVVIQCKSTTEVYTEISLIRDDSNISTKELDIIATIEQDFNDNIPSDEYIDPDNENKSILYAVDSSQNSFIGFIDIDGQQVQYVSMGYLFSKINEILRTRWENSTLNETPILEISEEYSKCSVLEHLISSDPKSVLLPGLDKYEDEPAEDDVPPNITPYEIWQNFWEGDSFDVRFNQDGSFGITANIMISLVTLKSIYDLIVKNEEEENSEEKESAKISITKFINLLSNTISNATGGCISLRLVPDPNAAALDETLALEARSRLILRDSNYANLQSTPYVFGLFSNSQSIFRNFEINGQIPDSLKQLALVFGSDAGDRIGGLLNYSYATRENQAKIRNEQREKYQKAADKLKEARNAYGKSPTETARKTLSRALLKYVNTPRLDASETNAPLPAWPLTVSFTLDGIYGLKFGDVLNITPLPAVYNDVVFIIVKIEHTISGQDWYTKVECLMRTKLI